MSCGFLTVKKPNLIYSISFILCGIIVNCGMLQDLRQQCTRSSHNSYHLHSTHECAQWIVALLTWNYCVCLSRYGCMPLFLCLCVYMCLLRYVWPYVTCDQTISPQLVNHWWAILSAIQDNRCHHGNWVYLCTLKIVFHNCMQSSGCECVLMHEFYQFWYYNWFTVKLTWLCIFSAIGFILTIWGIK